VSAKAQLGDWDAVRQAVSFTLPFLSLKGARRTRHCAEITAKAWLDQLTVSTLALPELSTEQKPPQLLLALLTTQGAATPVTPLPRRTVRLHGRVGQVARRDPG
jgi:hypothetical protein